jgi:prolyl-tRNA editing enzyme YbaK/EbsC (Cys-tRNA(Pro) deacylase)
VNLAERYWRRRPRRYPSNVTVPWPFPSVERVADVLRHSGADARIEEFAEETATAVEAARAAGCAPEQIVKTLVFIADGRPVVALVPGNRRADTGKIARAAAASNARTATAPEVEAATGFPPGGVAPFPLPGVERVLAERTLLAQPVVWVGAGSGRHMAVLAPHELVRLARAETMDVVQEPAYDAPSAIPGGS